MPVPAPVPPKPGFSPPEGERARDPVTALGGRPTFDPGWLEMTAPALVPLPPFTGGAEGAPELMDVPKAMPLRPRPEPAGADPPPTDGGGGTTLSASSVPVRTPAPPEVLAVPPPGPESDGGGGTTLSAPSLKAAEADGEREPTPLDTPTDGGGATTFEPREDPMPLRFP